MSPYRTDVEISRNLTVPFLQQTAARHYDMLWPTIAVQNCESLQGASPNLYPLCIVPGLWLYLIVNQHWHTSYILRYMPMCKTADHHNNLEIRLEPLFF